MDKKLHPEWVTRGKTIRQLIKELLTLENQDLEVRISLDCGETHRCVSSVGKRDGYCVLDNSEDVDDTEWQEFIKRGAVENANETESE